mmetsp:Transcript_17913/g.34648  ORF Transcript_17913/g.34648 Transcript_17913/m.34648 type:complete len:111 (+) Transcript_17913:141-473(+)
MSCFRTCARFVDRIVSLPRLRKALFTSHDKKFIHKTLAVLVVGHILYRYFKLFTTGRFGFMRETDIEIFADVVFCCLHPILAASSAIIFNPPVKMIKSLREREVDSVFNM